MLAEMAVWVTRFLFTFRFVFELLGQAGITSGNQVQTLDLIYQIITASISLDSKFSHLCLICFCKPIYSVDPPLL